MSGHDPTELGEGPESSTVDLLGALIAEKYRVVARLGVGGMGEVYRAEHTTLGVSVAIKTMHAHVAARVEYVRRFAREARALSILSHPNVVRVLDFGTHEGVPFLAMELLRGRSLGDDLEARGGDLPSLADVGRVLDEVLTGLAAAHELGIVHRDLKPDNVYLAEEHGRTVAKLVDFGLAHLDDARDQGPTLTKTEMVGGTPDYMSPEQCRSLRVGASTDLYAVGCILTTMLQGSPPFTGTSSMDIIAKHMFAPVPELERPDDLEPVPEALLALRRELLAKDPAERPPDARTVLERLREALDPASLANRLGTRSPDSMAPRELRAPWGEAPRKEAGAASTGTVEVRVAGGRAITDAHRLALSAAGVALVAAGGEVVVLDAGSDVDAAVKAVAAETRPVIVCLEGLDVAKMNALVAAGARDSLSAPAAPDGLVRRVTRLLRRKR